MRATTAVLLVAALMGCTAQRLAERQREFAEARQACAQRFPKVVGGMVAYSTCVNQAGEPLDGGGAANGLIRATRISLSDQVDRREISMAEANTQFARLMYETSQDTQRADATNASNAAAILLSMPAQRPNVVPYTPLSVPFQPAVNTSCMRIGQGMYSCH